MVRRIIALCTCLVVCAIARGQERHEADKRIVVLAWGGPPAGQATVERYRELAECGFTHSFSGFSNIAEMGKALDAAQAAGIKLLVSCPELQSDPQATVRKFKDHPATGGYFLRDEPAALDFDALAKWARSVESIDPRHVAYINLFPDYATAAQLGVPTYQHYVDRFVKDVPVQVISFDYYPIVSHSVRSSWYHNLEAIASASRSAGKPFWAFALSLRHYDYAPATVANLREQVYSNLAYGAQGIQYFTYWASPGLSNEALIDAQGKRTAVYDHVKQVNAEIRSLSFVFAGSKVLWTRHTGQSLPPGTQRFVAERPVRELVTQGSGAVVSMLEDGGHRFLVVVNRDIDHPMPLTVRFDAANELSEIRKDGSLRRLERSEFTADCDPGDARVLCWTQK